MRDVVRVAVMGLVVLTLMCVTLRGTGMAAEKMDAMQLIEMGKANNPGLRAAIVATLDAKELKEGTAWIASGPEFFFATEAAAKPEIFIDGAAGPEMRNISGSGLWYAAAHIEPVGRLHSFYYVVAGAHFGGRLDLPAFGALSYLQPGVRSGTLSEKIVHTSKIYDGMKSEYWIYVPAQYDARTAAALMVFQDGREYLDRDGRDPALNVIDNLIAERQIPVMICVFINPGDIDGSPGTPTYNFVKAYAEKWKRGM
jgi:enterochelin esterase family protein